MTKDKPNQGNIKLLVWQGGDVADFIQSGAPVSKVIIPVFSIEELVGKPEDFVVKGYRRLAS